MRQSPGVSATSFHPRSRLPTLFDRFDVAQGSMVVENGLNAFAASRLATNFSAFHSPKTPL